MNECQLLFERLHCGNNPNAVRKNSTTDEYVIPSVQDAWSGFKTAYEYFRKDK